MNPSNTIKLLGELAPESRGRVVRVSAPGSVHRRILEMGLVPGVEITVKGKAPLGDPMEIMVRGYRLSLRKEEANGVTVEVFQTEPGSSGGWW